MEFALYKWCIAVDMDATECELSKVLKWKHLLFIISMVKYNLRYMNNTSEIESVIPGTDSFRWKFTQTKYFFVENRLRELKKPSMKNISMTIFKLHNQHLNINLLVFSDVKINNNITFGRQCQAGLLMMISVFRRLPRNCTLLRAKKRKSPF